MDDTEKVAHHEAGHAVVGYELGKRFEYINIKKEGERFGTVRWEKRDIGREKELMMCVAGYISEEQFKGNDPEYVNPFIIPDKPITMSMEVRTCILESEIEPKRAKRAWDKTKEILETNYIAVIRLVEKLLKEKEIPGKEAMAFIKKYGADGAVAGTF